MTRFGWIIATYVAALGATASVLLHPLPKFIWNASASVPIGLYAVHPAGKLEITELVVVLPPDGLARFLAERRYLPEGVPMLKRVLALPGQTVCRSDRTITVDGIAMGDALEHDTRGRSLPVWQGCERVPENRVFLMNWQSPDSFDGRYFGLLSRATILGRADPVWTQEED
ncbi:MAG TPA: S26 family signal peptidase [Rhizomicrobium sp.]|jgi:conjugative transfer signal peptidase TraF|nr:S26 family signal peptidase [Rhizomicrobium sp.]